MDGKVLYDNTRLNWQHGTLYDFGGLQVDLPPTQGVRITRVPQTSPPNSPQSGVKTQPKTYRVGQWSWWYRVLRPCERRRSGRVPKGTKGTNSRPLPRLHPYNGTVSSKGVGRPSVHRWRETFHSYIERVTVRGSRRRDEDGVFVLVHLVRYISLSLFGIIPS